MSRILVTRSSMPEYEEYIEEIKDIWDSHWLTNMGAKHNELEKELSAEFDIEKRAELAVQMQQTVLDDHAFVFCSFLKMSMISKANVTGYESHACDYYQVTADLDIN